MKELFSNLIQMDKNIEAACARSGRNVSEVKVLLAIKTVNPELVVEALKYKSFLIGENKVQELKTKIDHEKLRSATWHFIGHLQTNKVKTLIAHVSMIHSVDNLNLVVELDKQLEKINSTIDILVQVNTSDEDSKFGLNGNELVPFLKRISEYKRVRVKGLMTLALLSNQADQVRLCFRKLKQLFDEVRALNIEGIEMNELSMGMSQDYEIAIEEGATIVRIGTAVFGKRSTPGSYYWDEKGNDHLKD